MPRRPPSLDRAIRNQLKRFRKRFGRDPLSDEPVFFDPDAPGGTPVPLDLAKARAGTIEAMSAAGIAPEVIFAFAKTGYIVVEGFEDRFTPEALAEWRAAIEEYGRLNADGKFT